MTISDEDFARAFAPMFEVLQHGAMRSATPADVLELIGPPRYALKLADGRYVANQEKTTGLTTRQRDALVSPERDWLREMCDVGLKQHGVHSRVVRHADGRQLQRVGIVPDIEVHPTLARFRAGKDEVLDRALEYLRRGRYALPIVSAPSHVESRPAGPAQRAPR